MIARSIAKVFALLVSGVAAFTGSQLPEFAQQYRQRIGGAIDELSAVIQRFDADASQAGLSREAALARHHQNPEAFFRRRGLAMEEAVVRHERLQAHQARLAESAPLARLRALLQADPLLARATLQIYEPAIPVSTEGFLLGAVGFAMGYLGYGLGALLLRRPSSRRSSPPESA